MSAMQWLEAASYTVTVIGLPFAFWVFWIQQRKERENEEEAAYQSLSDAYNEFLKVTLVHPDLRLRSATPLADPTPEQVERMRVIFEMLIALFERAYLISWRDDMSETERRRWNSWDDYMREWCRYEVFRLALPLLLRGEDPGFVIYIRRVADEEAPGIR
jgi:hypothetical protein